MNTNVHERCDIYFRVPNQSPLPRTLPPISSQPWINFECARELCKLRQPYAQSLLA